MPKTPISTPNMKNHLTKTCSVIACSTRERKIINLRRIRLFEVPEVKAVIWITILSLS